MKAVITGGAGFIGSCLSEALARSGWEITIFDNLSTGSKDNLAELIQDSAGNHLKLIVGDCLNRNSMKMAIEDCDVIFHFAANPEVRMEMNSPKQCFQQNVVASHNVLESFRESRAETFVFASTSTVYGEAKTLPTPENYAPLEPISVYGASKLAGEALVSSYCHAFDRHGIILRLANVIGPKSKHGVVCEFMARLFQGARGLSILGDGTQNKSYIYVDDCIDAILATMKHVDAPVNVFNVGSEDSLSVKEIAITVGKTMGLPKLEFSFNGGLDDGRGWVGDVKAMLLDVTKLKSIGWTPKLKSRAAVELTAKGILQRRKVSVQ